MPNFAQSTSTFTHTVDSAMRVLDAFGVSESRVTLRMAGLGRPSLEIVSQSPPPGSPLISSVRIVLFIAGFGFFSALPLPMRESGGEAEMGTREICQVFDDPLQKAAQWFRAGAPLFAIGPDKPAACRRWLSLFGIDPTLWPEELLYPLALLAPTLVRFAGRQIGVKLAFLMLFGLPVYEICNTSNYRSLPANQCSLFGAQASRLGTDLLLGDRQADADAITVRLGPVTLVTYESFQTPDGRRLLELATDLCLSAYQQHQIGWLVENESEVPRLGVAASNSRIGLNFHLGRGASV
ncbi:type VI secretion system baseplate subunit TssG [Granulicella sp. S190]|uniref:type VI secretion system baseplate subunit TssG n=1 Tax=Granulicella sp. S190 TaxID=1747226 RepID=UPI00131E07A6|nr:type VI secretion system baseplate subunit TssG [Granulicella sp. S190]